jgi:hypothetical protein
MREITDKRESSQPTKAKTGGSTSRTPTGHSSWKLIDAAGCRGLKVGDAQMSELHANFLLNLGDADAYEIETLGETVRNRVRARFRHRAQLGDPPHGPLLAGPGGARVPRRRRLHGRRLMSKACRRPDGRLVQ